MAEVPKGAPGLLVENDSSFKSTEIIRTIENVAVLAKGQRPGKYYSAWSHRMLSWAKTRNRIQNTLESCLRVFSSSMIKVWRSI